MSTLTCDLPSWNYITQPLKKNASFQPLIFRGELLVSGTGIWWKFQAGNFSSKQCEMFRLQKVSLVFWAGCSCRCKHLYLSQLVLLDLQSCLLIEGPAKLRKKSWLPLGETSVVSSNLTFFWLNFPTFVFVVGRCWEDFCFQDQLSVFFRFGRPCLAIPWKKLRSWDWNIFFWSTLRFAWSSFDETKGP